MFIILSTSSPLKAPLYNGFPLLDPDFPLDSETFLQHSLSFDLSPPIQLFTFFLILLVTLVAFTVEYATPCAPVPIPSTPVPWVSNDACIISSAYFSGFFLASSTSTPAFSKFAKTVLFFKLSCKYFLFGFSSWNSLLPLLLPAVEALPIISASSFKACLLFSITSCDFLTYLLLNPWPVSIAALCTRTTDATSAPSTAEASVAIVTDAIVEFDIISFSLCLLVT